MLHEGWRDGVAHVPVPIAVLDDHCRVRMMNPASKQDTLLAQAPIGGTMLDGAGGSSELLSRAETRQRWFQRSLNTRRSLVFDDEDDLSPTFRWLCLPVMEEDGPHLFVLGSTQTSSETSGSAERTPTADLIRTVHDELRAPLASMVAMAATLSNEATDDISTRAQLINQTGRQVLRRLTVLLRTSEGKEFTNGQ